MRRLTLFFVMIIFLIGIAGISRQLVQSNTAVDNRITNEVCVFVDVDHPVSEKELMEKINEAFKKASATVSIRFEGSFKVTIKNYFQPTDEEMSKIFALTCTHRGARMVVTGLEVGDAVKDGKIPYKCGGVTYYGDQFSIIFESNKIFEDAIVHEWGHQIIGESYSNSKDPGHSLNPQSWMFGGSGRKWSSVKRHVWTTEDLRFINEKIRIIDAVQ